MAIDWQGLQTTNTLAQLAGQNNGLSSQNHALLGQVDEMTKTSAALGVVVQDRDRKIQQLLARLAEAENEIRHLKSRDAGLLAEVRALLEEARKCPNHGHHTLEEADENGHSHLDDHYEDAYNNTWNELSPR